MTAIDLRGWLRGRRARRPGLSVVVPTLNEANNLAVVLPELQKVLESIPGDHEVILVDGGSEDGTIEAIEDPSRPFWLGVQWHAEGMIERPEHLALFAALVGAAAGPRLALAA